MVASAPPLKAMKAAGSAHAAEDAERAWLKWARSGALERLGGRADGASAAANARRWATAVESDWLSTLQDIARVAVDMQLRRRRALGLDADTHAQLTHRVRSHAHSTGRA